MNSSLTTYIEQYTLILTCMEAYFNFFSGGFLQGAFPTEGFLPGGFLAGGFLMIILAGGIFPGGYFPAGFLKRASFRGAFLQGAYFRGALLRGFCRGAFFLEPLRQRGVRQGNYWVFKAPHMDSNFPSHILGSSPQNIGES